MRKRKHALKARIIALSVAVATPLSSSPAFAAPLEGEDTSISDEAVKEERENDSPLQETPKADEGVTPEVDAEETEKPEADGEEAPKAEADGEEAPKAEADGEEAPKAEADGEEAPKAEADGEEAPKAEADGEEAPKTEAEEKDSAQDADKEGRLSATKPVVPMVGATQDGWVEEDGEMYYYVDGYPVTSTVMEIDGALYGFRSSGARYTSTSFGLWLDDGFHEFLAREDGTLYADCWYKPSEGPGSEEEPVYYTPEGYLAEGVVGIDEITYLFREGRLWKNTFQRIDDNWYTSDSDGVATKVTVTTGWVQMGDDYYYLKDNELVASQILKIGDDYYGFNYDGRMCVDGLYSFWTRDEELSQDVYKQYYAGEDGVLLRNEWKEDDWGSLYYFTDDCSGAEGLYPVDGTLYYFNNGSLVRNTMVKVDEKWYSVDEDGIAREENIQDNGWNEINGKTYYFVDGEPVKNLVKEIEGEYYGFGWDGVLFKNNSFTIWDSELQKDCCYFAGEDGVLYRNQWRDDEYYYTDDCRAAAGIYEIDGTKYYFSDYGYLLYNRIVLVDGQWYIVDEQGVATETTLSPGWNQINGAKYYVTEDGELVTSQIRKIGNAYYGFEEDGKVYTDTTFDMYLYEDGEYLGHFYFRAKKDGKLYQNEWYKNLDAQEAGYYGEDCRALTGFNTIDGVGYLFDSNGNLYFNRVIEHDDKWYGCDAEGVATEISITTGWYELSGKYYYFLDGSSISNQVIQIGSDYYGFRWDGQRYENCVFSLDQYDFETDTWVCHYYKAKADGTLYRKEWSGDRYFGDDCASVTGLSEVDGALYYFDENGYLVQNDLVSVDGNWYSVDGDGVATLQTVREGWNTIEGNTYYFVNGEPLKYQVRKIDGFYYGFNRRGELFTNQSFGIEVYDEEGTYIGYNFYLAKKDGKLYQNEWVEYDDWGDIEKYYYGADAAAASGLKKIDGVIYYFTEDGMLYNRADLIRVNGKWVSVNEEGVATRVTVQDGWNEFEGIKYYFVDGEPLKDQVAQIGDKYYGFNWRGRMYRNTRFSIEVYCEPVDSYDYYYYLAKDDGTLYQNEWYYEDDHDSYPSSYYGPYAAAYTGFQTIDGKKYYFDGEGILQRNALIQERDKWYKSDKDGVVSEAAVSDGWFEHAEKWYYFENGEMLRYTVKEIKGDYYGFASDGHLYMNTAFYLEYFDDHDYYSEAYYRAKADGKLYRSEWYEYRGEKYFYSATGQALEGLATLKGVTYLFDYDGRAYTDCVKSYSGEWYAIDEDGVATKISVTDGWVTAGRNRFYFRNGEPVCNEVILISGHFYGFDREGTLFEAGSFGIRNDDDGSYKYYRAKADGVLCRNEWYHDANSSSYYLNDCTAATGLCEIEGKLRYFSEGGYLYRNSVVQINESWYTIDDEGIVTALSDPDGWIDAGTERYYMEDGELVRGRILKIGDAYYGFSDEGSLYRNRLFWMYEEVGGQETEYRYYAKADGTLYRNEWADDHDYYFLDDCRGADGLVEISGKTYLFRDGELIRSGLSRVDGIWYSSNDEGVATVLKNTSGWVQVDSYKYYFKDGEPVRGRVIKIGNAYYGFMYDGKLYTNTSFESEIDDEWRYFRAKADGTLYTGWVNYYGTRYYYHENGMAACGIEVIDKQKYLFNYTGELLINRVQYDGETDAYYMGDAEGHPKKMVNGWNTASDGTKYYFENGEPLVYTVKKIGNAYYGFGRYGAMYKDTSFSFSDEEDQSISYRAKANGTLYTSAWYEAGDQRYFYKANAQGATGILTLGGKKYAFDEDGRMRRSEYFYENGVGYLADSKGGIQKAAAGWNKVDGNNYYLKKGAFVWDAVVKIGADYYGFDWEGRLLKDQSFYSWDESTGKYAYYRAQGNGKLLRNTWDGFYYYQANGQSLRGRQKVGGKYYYFNYDGQAISNEYVVVDGVSYHAAASGVLSKVTKDGLYRTGIGKYDLIYISGGKTLKNQWKTVGGKKYYFGSDGYAYRNDVYSISGKLYLFNSDGTLASSGWQCGDQYFVAKDGSLVTGKVKLGGVWYYFDKDWGEKQHGCVEVNGKKELYGADGKYVGTISKKGWNTISDQKYYLLDNGEMAEGYWKIGGAGYLFERNYNTKAYPMAKNIRRWCEAGECLFTSTGKQLQNGWYQLEGAWYYAKNGELVDGLQTIGGKKYLFEDYVMVYESKVIDGTLYTINKSGVVTSTKKVANGTWTLADGDYYYYKNGKPFTGWVGKYYILNGVMQRNGITKDGYWVNYNGAYQSTAGWAVSGSGKGKTVTAHYVKKGGKLAKKQWLQIGKKWYYFNEEYCAVDGPQKIDGVWYLFSDNVYVKTLGKKLPNGWVKGGKYWYYFDFGSIVEGVKSVDGKAYNFAYSRMLEGTLYDGRYSAASGVVQAYTGWKQLNGKWYYFDKLNQAVTHGWIYDGSKHYYMYEGELVTGSRVINGRLYQFAGSGAMVKQITAPDGWYQLGKDWYYFENGRALTSRIVTYQGKNYLMGEDGRMVTNGSARSYYGNGGLFYADKNGVIVTNTWKKVDGVDRYFGADGTALFGAQKIGGKEYYFD